MSNSRPITYGWIRFYPILRERLVTFGRNERDKEGENKKKREKEGGDFGRYERTSFRST